MALTAEQKSVVTTWIAAGDNLSTVQKKLRDELHEESLEELKARRVDAQSGQVDVDEAEAAESIELPGADLSGEELSVRVVPRQTDEFACSRCFLVHHISQLAKGEGAKAVCKECA